MVADDLEDALDLLRRERDPLFREDGTDVLRILREDVRNLHRDGVGHEVQRQRFVDDGLGLLLGDRARLLGVVEGGLLRGEHEVVPSAGLDLCLEELLDLCDSDVPLLGHGDHSTFLTRCSGRATTVLVLLPSLTLTS